MKYASILLISFMCLNGCKQTPTVHKRVMNHEYYKKKSSTNNSDCSHLSIEEQKFAKKLSSFHKKIFCKDFSSFQRKEASEANQNISADEAVEQVINRSRDMH